MTRVDSAQNMIMLAASLTGIALDLKAICSLNVFALQLVSIRDRNYCGGLHTMNLLWKSLRKRSLTNSGFPFFSVPLAWFRKTTSSSHLLFASASRFGFNNGLPNAISDSLCSCSRAALSFSSCSFFSALSFLILSSSRRSSAVSSSSSSLSSSL